MPHFSSCEGGDAVTRNNFLISAFLCAVLFLFFQGCSDSDGSDDQTTDINPDDVARISGYIDSLPWGQQAIDAAGKREELIDSVIRGCDAFAPPGDEWQPWCQAFLIAAACRESSLQIDLVNGPDQNPSVGLLQIRFGYSVRDFDGYGKKEAIEQIGCAWPDFSDLDAEDWATQGPQWFDFLQDVPCNIGVGAWYYFYNATGNGEPAVYAYEYCAGEGVPANLVVGMLSYVGGPSNGVFDENDPYPPPYVSLIKEYFDAMFASVPEPHPFIRELPPDPEQYCENPPGRHFDH
jgi:hypothetical protein